MASPFLIVMVTTLALSLSLQLNCVEAKVSHHIVGNDRGWDPSADVTSWAASRAFRVGDSLWFTYSSALETVVELRSKEEYESCDLSNPMRKYNDGLSKVTLEGEGIRYFSSGNTESCKKGLKIPVRVKPKMTEPIAMKPLARSEKAALAEAPMSPSPLPSPSAGALEASSRAAVLLGVAFLILMGCNMK